MGIPHFAAIGWDRQAYLLWKYDNSEIKIDVSWDFHRIQGENLRNNKIIWGILLLYTHTQ